MADRTLHWFLPNAYGPSTVSATYILDSDYLPTALLMLRDGGESQVQIDIKADSVSIFSSGLLPGFQRRSERGERDYFAEPRILKRGSLMKLEIVSIEEGSGRNLNVHLELERA